MIGDECKIRIPADLEICSLCVKRALALRSDVGCPPFCPNVFRQLASKIANREKGNSCTDFSGLRFTPIKEEHDDFYVYREAIILEGTGNTPGWQLQFTQWLGDSGSSFQVAIFVPDKSNDEPQRWRLADGRWSLFGVSLLGLDRVRTVRGVFSFQYSPEEGDVNEWRL